MFNFLLVTFALTFFALHFAEGNEISCERIAVYHLQYGFPNLKTCFLDESTRIDSNTFTMSPKSNEEMSLKFTGNENIFYLPTKLHETFSTVALIHASRCAIKSVSKENFMNLGKLVTLNLGRNQIKSIDSNTFDDLTSLETLNLEHNPIKIMSDDVFKNLKQLEFVDLTNLACIDDMFYDDRLPAIVGIVDDKCGPKCGKAPVLSGRVIGGTQANRGQWPFLVALEYREGNELFCGGNLISSRHVLTGEFNVLGHRFT